MPRTRREKSSTGRRDKGTGTLSQDILVILTELLLKPNKNRSYRDTVNRTISNDDF